MRIQPLIRRISFALVAVTSLVIGMTSPAHAATANPDAVAYSQSGNDVVLEGTHMDTVTGVSFNTTKAASFKIISASKIEAVAPSNLPVGYYDIYLTNANGQTETPFNFTKGGPPPTIASMSPSTLDSRGGQTLVVKGTNFVATKVVTIDGQPTNWTNPTSTQINVVTPAHVSGATRLSITTLGGTAQTNVTYTGTATAPLRLSALSVDYGYIGGNKAVTITGSGFAQTRNVKFAGVNAKSYKVVSDTRIDAISPFTTKGGVGQLTVSDTKSTVGAKWTYLYVKPTVTNVSGTGSQLTLDGWGFTGVTTVTVDGAKATIASVQDKKIVITKPNHAPGTVAVTVTNPAATSPQKAYTF